MPKSFQNIADLRDEARRRLPKMVFDFVDRGAEDEVALVNNHSRLKEIKLLQRPLIDTGSRSTKCTVLGREQDFPVIISPTGIGGILWHNGEVALARGAAKAGIPYSLATTSVTAMEDVMRATEGQLWYQIYLWSYTDMVQSMVERARAAGFGTLIVTVDSPVPPNREYNIRNGYSVPFRLSARNIMDVLTHPRWMVGTLGRYMLEGGLPTFKNYPPELMAGLLSKKIDRRTFNNPRQTWDDVKRLRDSWPGKLIVKGIIHPDDVDAAANVGADAVSISNHGGRTLDAAPATIDMVRHAVKAARGRLEVLVDGGFLRGEDVVKALAMGAKAVLVGRGVLYGVSVSGQEGVELALDIYRSEIDRVMAYLGRNSIAQLDESVFYDSLD